MHNLIRFRVFLLVLCGLLPGGCRAPAVGPPFVEFSRVPGAEAGGIEKLDRIEGRVNGARPGQRIVLYARSGAWYVQPFTDQPFTEIQPDSTWKNSTHLGTDYAALLVEPGYSPPARTDELPGIGGGVVAAAAVPGEPVFWQKWWFRVGVGLALVPALLAFYRRRLRRLSRQLNLRFEERLAERTRIAQELHDTLLQDVLSVSMQLHVVAENLPGDSAAREQLGHVRQIVERVVEEGRNTLRGLRTNGGTPTELKEAFARLPHDLAAQGPIDYRVNVEGHPRPLHPVIRDEVYRIGRETLTDVLRHSRTVAVEIEIEYSKARLRLFVRAGGVGPDSQARGARREVSAGLSGMRERAERIGARIKVRGRGAGGTEVELSVPGDVAFLNEHSSREGRLFSRLFARKSRAETVGRGGGAEG